MYECISTNVINHHVRFCVRVCVCVLSGGVPCHRVYGFYFGVHMESVCGAGCTLCGRTCVQTQAGGEVSVCVCVRMCVYVSGRMGVCVRVCV